MQSSGANRLGTLQQLNDRTPPTTEGWKLTLEGDVTDTITQSFFIEAIACKHKITWTDGSGNVWRESLSGNSQVPLTTWNPRIIGRSMILLLLWVTPSGYLQGMAIMKPLPGDVARNGGYFVANNKNSTALSGTEAPLKLVGSATTGGKACREYRKYRLEGLPAYPSGAWSLQLDGAISDIIPQEFEMGGLSHCHIYR